MEMKFTHKDYGYDTPAQMAFVAWAGQFRSTSRSIDYDMRNVYTVTDWSGDGYLTIRPVSGNGEVTVSVDEVTFASR
jgi:hypothetical protein